jgi:hypothetical protein
MVVESGYDVRACIVACLYSILALSRGAKMETV